MFDPLSVEQYRHIKAPADLKERVLDTANRAVPTRSVKRFFPVIAAAACLVVLVVGFAFGSFSQDNITITPSFAADTAAFTRDHQIYADIVITADVPITVTDLDEAITLPPNDEDALHPLSLPYTAEDTLTLRWHITSDTAEMTVNGRTYTLCADLPNGQITVQ